MQSPVVSAKPPLYCPCSVRFLIYFSLAIWRFGSLFQSFSSAPHLFQQLYTVHVVQFNTVFPVVYAFYYLAKVGKCIANFCKKLKIYKWAFNQNRWWLILNWRLCKSLSTTPNNVVQAFEEFVWNNVWRAYFECTVGFCVFLFFSFYSRDSDGGKGRLKVGRRDDEAGGRRIRGPLSSIIPIIPWSCFSEIDITFEFIDSNFCKIKSRVASSPLLIEIESREDKGEFDLNFF